MAEFRTRQWTFNVAPVGTQQTISADFDISTLIIQNPTGMWLYIPSVRQYIPPQQLGSIIPVIPSSKSINIQYVNTPTGGLPSTVAGNQIIVDAYNIAMAPYQGLDYGLDQSISGLNALITTTNTLLGTLNTSIASLQASIDVLESGWGITAASGILTTTIPLTGIAFQTIIPAAPGQQIKIYNIYASRKNSPYARGSVSFEVDFNGGVDVLYGALSPETPYIAGVIPPGGLVGPVNTELRGFLGSVTDSTTIGVYVGVQYALV